MRKQSFIQGTYTLTAAAFFTRALGFINGIVLARYLGKEGIGLMMMAHPLLPLFITLTELGLPAAISKMVSEAEVENNPSRVRRILSVSLSVTGTLSVLLTLCALLGSKWIASVFLPDPRAYYPMLALTPIIPLIAMTAVLRGYFRGKQNMKPLAISDIIEHVAQIIVIIGVVQVLLPYGIVYAAAGAMISSVVGEGLGLLYLFIMFQRYRRAKKSFPAPPSSSGEWFQTLRELLGFGLPMTGSGLVLSVYRAFMPMLVIKCLMLSGVGSATLATKDYGLLTGFVYPLLFFPSFFTHSLSTALIPAISETMANRNDRLMYRRIDLAMRVALFVGIPCSALLYIWAVPLTTVIYHAPDAGPLLRLLVPFFFFYYFESPLYAILLGLGRSSTVMWNLIISNLLESVAIFMLGSRYGITGVAIGLGLGIFFLFALNFWSVSSKIGLYLEVRLIFKAIVGAIVMAICGLGTYSILERSGFNELWGLVGAILVSLLIYISTLQAIGTFYLKTGTPPIKNMR